MKILIYFPMLALLFACTENQTTETPSTRTEETVNTPSPADSLALAPILAERKRGFLEKAPEEKIQAYEQGIEEVAKSGLLESAMQVGDLAPDFSLPNATGDATRLSDLLSQGPVILTWYRGGWCPYCNLTLHNYQQHLPAFKEAGAQLVALTPELPDSSLSTAEKNELSFQVLSDVGQRVAKDFGIVFQLNETVSGMYKQSFSLADYNGNDSEELPLAATYVIASDGTIAWAFLDADYRNRAEPTDILEALNQL